MIQREILSASGDDERDGRDGRLEDDPSLALEEGSFSQDEDSDATAHPHSMDELLRHADWVRGLARSLLNDPDMVDDAELKSAIVEMLQANDSMKLETAYWAARGQLGARRTALAAEQAEQERRRRAAELRTQTSTGRRAEFPDRA